MIHSAHNTIWYTIWCTWYDTFRDTCAILTWEAEACDPCHQKYCTPPTTTACAVMMRSGYDNGGLLGVSRCGVFARNSLSLLEYTNCYLWYLVFVSNFGMCYICTVWYRIVLGAYRDTYRSLCIGDIPVCRCIVSALFKIILRYSRGQWVNLHCLTGINYIHVITHPGIL